MWFGKREATKLVGDAAKGIGKYIDEQKLTAEEVMTYRMQLLQMLHPFKQIQRIIVTFVLSHWAFWAVNWFLASWLEHSGYILAGMTDNLERYAKLEIVWTPTLGVFSLYLLGGVVKK